MVRGPPQGVEVDPAKIKVSSKGFRVASPTSADLYLTCPEAANPSPSYEK